MRKNNSSGDEMKAVIYSRVSTDHQSEGSVEQQIRKCREYCAFKDYEVVEVYSDVGSGMKTELSLIHI